MAILVLFPYLPYPFHHSGASQLIYRIVQQLGRQEDVDMMVFHQPSHSPRDIEQVQKQVRQLIILPFQIPGQRRCLLRYRLFMKPVRASLSRTIHQIIRKNDYRLIVSVSYLSALLLHSFPPDRIIALPIDAFSRLHRQLARNTHDPIKKILHKFSAGLFTHFERKALHLYKKTVVVSAHDCRYLNRVNPKLDCRAIPLGIESKQFPSTSLPREPRSMLFTGNYAYTPNRQAAIFLLKQVMPLLNRQLSGVKLYLVGIHPSQEMLDFQSDQIIIPGFVKDIDHYYRTCELFICPLTSATGVKNKILEAAASGMPILASRKSLEGINMASGTFCVAQTATDFATQAADLLSNQPYCQQLGAQAQNQVSLHHNAHEMSRRYVEMILSSLSEADIPAISKEGRCTAGMPEEGLAGCQ